MNFLALRILAAACVVAFCSAAVTPAAPIQMGDPVIGHISWVIYGGSKMTTRGVGNKIVHLSDVTIDTRSQRAIKKQIALSEHFVLTYSEIPKPSKNLLNGFGIGVVKDNLPSFSWEWFRVVKPGQAMKIREKGRIGFSQVKVGKRWQIARMNFPVDISCRITNSINDHSRPRWRVKILKGSTITWPKLVKGKIVAN
jgi:hypothetical protein